MGGKARDRMRAACAGLSPTAEPFLVLGPRSHKRTMTQGVFRGVQEKSLIFGLLCRTGLRCFFWLCPVGRVKVESTRGGGGVTPNDTGVFCLMDQLGLPRQSQAAADAKTASAYRDWTGVGRTRDSTDQMAGVILLPWAGSTQAMRLSNEATICPCEPELHRSQGSQTS